MSNIKKSLHRRAFEGSAVERAGEPAANGPSAKQYQKAGSSARGRPRMLVALTPQGARKAGLLVERGDGILSWVRVVDSARHLLRLPEKSWSVNEQALLEAHAAGATRVEVHDQQDGVWWTSPSYLLSHGRRFDRGWGPQIRLRLSEWSFLPADSITPHQQLGLFAEMGR